MTRRLCRRGTLFAFQKEVKEAKEVNEVKGRNARIAACGAAACFRFLYLLYFLYVLYLTPLITGWPRQCVDERAGTRRVVPHLKRGVEVEDVACSDAAACTVDREHRVAIDFVEVDIFEHGASPVREVEEIHAGLVRVHAGLDGNPAHRFAAAEKQIEIVAAAVAAFLDDLANGDAE